MHVTKDWSQIVLVFVSIILLTVNIFLIIQNRQLKSSLEQSRQVVIEEGYRFSHLSFRGVDGVEDKIDLADGKLKTLILVFNSSCKYCGQQYPYWRELTRDLGKGSWRVLAISSEDDREKIKAHMEAQNIENIRVGSVGAEEMRRSRMLFTPMTIAVDTNGEVKKVWTGLWTKRFDLIN